MCRHRKKWNAEEKTSTGTKNAGFFHFSRTQTGNWSNRWKRLVKSCLFRARKETSTLSFICKNNTLSQGCFLQSWLVPPQRHVESLPVGEESVSQGGSCFTENGQKSMSATCQTTKTNINKLKTIAPQQQRNKYLLSPYCLEGCPATPKSKEIELIK